MRSLSIFLGLSLVFALAGCVSTQSFDDTARDELVHTLPELPDSWQTASESDASPLGWVAGFNDPALETLIVEAQANNRSIAVAAANLDRSRALVQQARSGLKPTVNVAAGGARAGSSGSGNPEVDDFSLGAQMSWEVDVWGRLRSGAMAAYYSNEAVEADY